VRVLGQGTGVKLYSEDGPGFDTHKLKEELDRLLYTVLLRPYVRRLSHPIFFEPGIERIQLIGGHRALMTRSKPWVSELTVVKVQ
jgi:hypothetical protein